MLNQILNMENKNQEFNSSDKNVNLIMQFVVEGYLKRKEQPSMKEMLAEFGIEDKAGVIYNYHIAFIQMMLAEELLTVNVKLEEEVNKIGETFELGKLSSYEKKYLENKIENIANIIDVIQEKTQKKNSI